MHTVDNDCGECLSENVANKTTFLVDIVLQSGHPATFFCSFSDLNRTLAGKKFRKNEGIIVVTVTVFFLSKRKAKDRPNRFIALDSNYNE